VIWKSAFATKKKRLSKVVSAGFQTFVEGCYHSFTRGRKERTKEKIPRQFSIFIDGRKADKEEKVQVVESQTGSHAVLLINDKTEALGKYVKTKEARFGKFCVLVCFWLLVS
jgi:hypothetical protein